MMSKVSFEELPEYAKDFKRLLKKYISLEQDMATLKKSLADEPDATPPLSFEINGLGIETCVIKVKKIACRALKTKGVNSGLRLIYAWFEKESRIILVELYHKSEKEVEDRERILRNFK